MLAYRLQRKTQAKLAFKSAIFVGVAHTHKEHSPLTRVLTNPVNFVLRTVLAYRFQRIAQAELAFVCPVILWALPTPARNSVSRLPYSDQARRLIGEPSKTRRIEYADGSLLCVNKLGARKYNVVLHRLYIQAYQA